MYSCAVWALDVVIKPTYGGTRRDHLPSIALEDAVPKKTTPKPKTVRSVLNAKAESAKAHMLAKMAKRHRARGAKQRADDPHGLTDKERAFVTEYLVDNNGQEAARRAGYTAKNDNSLRSMASQLLAKLNVRAALATAKADHVKHVIVTKEWLEREYMANHFAARANGEITASTGALKELAKTAGLSTDKLQLLGPNGGPVQADITAGPRGLSDEVANDIRIKVLGVHPRHLLEDPYTAIEETSPKAVQ